MSDYDTDDSSVELLIQHHSLDTVLAFVNARDEVRRIHAPPRVEEDVEPCSAPTLRAEGHVESSPIEIDVVHVDDVS